MVAARICSEVSAAGAGKATGAGAAGASAGAGCSRASTCRGAQEAPVVSLRTARASSFSASNISAKLRSTECGSVAHLA